MEKPKLDPEFLENITKMLVTKIDDVPCLLNRNENAIFKLLRHIQQLENYIHFLHQKELLEEITKDL